MNNMSRPAVNPWIMAFIFAPINTAAYMYLPEEQSSNATGLFNMARNEGASLGIAIYNTMLARRVQFHQNRLVDAVTVLDQPFVTVRDQLTHQFQTAGYDAVTAGRMALSQIYRLTQQQVGALAYLDLYWIFGVLALCAAPLVFLMRRSVPEQGTSVVGH
jgi:DHA2 family multidrug resistance protein